MNQFYEVSYSYNLKTVYIVYGKFIDGTLDGRYIVKGDINPPKYSGNWLTDKSVTGTDIGYLKLITSPRRLSKLKKQFGVENQNV